MSTLRTRLRKLEGACLCRRHRTPLTCVVCEGDELTDTEWAEVEHWLIVLGVLTPQGDLTAQAQEPRAAGSCRRCGHALYCLDCQVPGAEARYADAYARLTAEAQARLDTLMRKFVGTR